MIRLGEEMGLGKGCDLWRRRYLEEDVSLGMDNGWEKVAHRSHGPGDKMFLKENMCPWGEDGVRDNVGLGK
jgi:hypothetical protein